MSAASGKPGRGGSSENDLAVSILMALHRLAKQSTLYDGENQAQLRQIESVAKAIAAYGRRTGENFKISFGQKGIFIGKRLLRASRSVYQAARELGSMLRPLGIDELAIGHDVPLDDLHQFQVALGAALRQTGPSPTTLKYHRIRLRRGRPNGRSVDEERAKHATPEDAIIHSYALAVVMMRHFFEDILHGRYDLSTRVRRVAQKLADLSEVQTPTFLGVTALRNTKHDDAGRAVNAALLSLGMARQLTNDKRILARIVTAALLHDIGRARVAGAGPTGEERLGSSLPRLAEFQLAGVSAATAAVVSALDARSESATMVGVVVYEAALLSTRPHSPLLYGGLQTASLEAHIVSVAARFSTGIGEDGADDAVDRVVGAMWRNQENQGDQTAMRLLLGALGLFPVGAVVELSDRRVAQVVRTPLEAQYFSRPDVQLTLDATGAPLAQAEILQLSAPASQDIHVARVLSVGDSAEFGTAPTISTSAPAAGSNLKPAEPSARDDDTDNGGLSHERPVGATHERPAAGGASGPSDPSDPTDDDDAATNYYDGGPPRLSALGNAIVGAVAESKDALDIDLDVEPDLLKVPMADKAPEADDALEVSLPGSNMASPAPPSPPGEAVPSTPAARTSQPPPTPPTEAMPSTPPPSKPSSERVPIPIAPKSRPSSRPPPPSQRTAGSSDSSEPPPSSASRARLRSRHWLQERLTGKKPSAQGVLTKTPIVHLLVYALDQELTGSCVFTTPEGDTHIVIFNEGAPAKVRTTGTIAPLDRVAVELGFADEKTLDKTLAAVSTTGQLHGELLVSRGHIDAAQLDTILQQQLMRKIGFIVRLPAATRFAYYGGLNLLNDYGGADFIVCDPLAMIMMAVRLRAQAAEVDDTLNRLGETTLTMHHAADATKLTLTDREERVCDLLRAQPMTLAQLVGHRVAQERVAMLTVYALVITRCLALGGKAPLGALKREHRTSPRPLPDTAADSSRASSRPSAPPPPSSRSSRAHSRQPQQQDVTHSRKEPARRRANPAQQQARIRALQERDKARRIPLAESNALGNKVVVVAIDVEGTPTPQQIDAVADQLDTQTFFEMLGVQTTATDDEIQTAYFKIAKIWHPDRLPDALVHKRADIAKVFARFNEAFQALSQAESRAKYITLVQSGGGTVHDQEMVERAVDSALLFQKAEVLFKKGSLAHAEEMLKQAVQADPEQPEYLTLLAWVESQRIAERPAPTDQGEDNGKDGDDSKSDGDKTEKEKEKEKEKERLARYEKQIQMLSDVLKKEPYFERALDYRGRLYKRSGIHRKALRDFKSAVEINPHNIDAAREVRLYAKKKKEEQATSKGGIFGGLFSGRGKDSDKDK